MALNAENSRCQWILNIDGLSNEAKEQLYKQCLLETTNNVEEFNWGGDDFKDLNLETFNNNEFYPPVSNPKFTITPSQQNRKFTIEQLYKRYVLKAINWINLFTQYHIPKNYDNWEVLPTYEKRMVQKIIFCIVDFWSINMNPLEYKSDITYNNPYGYNIQVSNNPHTDWNQIIGTEATHMLISTGWTTPLYFVNTEKKGATGNLSDIWKLLNLLVLKNKALEKKIDAITDIEAEDLENIKWLTEKSITNIIGNYGSLLEISEIKKEKPPEKEIIINNDDTLEEKFRKSAKLLEAKKINFIDARTYESLSHIIAINMDDLCKEKFKIDTNFRNTVNAYPHLRELQPNPLSGDAFIRLQLYKEDDLDQKNAIDSVLFQWFGFPLKSPALNGINENKQGREFKLDTSKIEKEIGDIQVKTRIGYQFKDGDGFPDGEMDEWNDDDVESFRLFGSKIVFTNDTVSMENISRKPYFRNNITIKDTYNDFFDKITSSTEAIKWLYTNTTELKKRVDDCEKDIIEVKNNHQLQTDPQLYLRGNDASNKLQKIYDMILNSNIGTTILISCAFARIIDGQQRDFCDSQFELSKGQNNGGRVIFLLKYAENKDGKPPQNTEITFDFIKENIRIYQQGSILQGNINWESVKVPESAETIEYKARCLGCAE